MQCVTCLPDYGKTGVARQGENGAARMAPLATSFTTPFATPLDTGIPGEIAVTRPGRTARHLILLGSRASPRHPRAPMFSVRAPQRAAKHADRRKRRQHAAKATKRFQNEASPNTPRVGGRFESYHVPRACTPCCTGRNQNYSACGKTGFVFSRGGWASFLDRRALSSRLQPSMITLKPINRAMCRMSCK